MLLFQYIIRAASRDAIFELLSTAQEGKERPFVLEDDISGRNVDPSRIRYPYPEMNEGVFDSESGETITPAEPTGSWLCEVWLTEPDSDLAAIAEAP